MFRQSGAWRPRKLAAGSFATPSRPASIVVLPAGVSLSGRAFADAVSEPDRCPYPVFAIEPPEVSPALRALSVAALAAACLYGAWGGMVGVVLPSLLKVSSIYYGGDAFKDPRMLQAVGEIVGRADPIGQEPDRVPEVQAFTKELKELRK
jgi:hypothetical protein